MNAQQVPHCKQRRVIYLLAYAYKNVCQKPGMDRNYCLIVFIVYVSYSDT
jgi:hypothetical protein